MAEITTTLPDVQSQAGALVGDENQPAPREPEVIVNDTPVPAQVVAEAGPPVKEVVVHETAVSTDEVITDPSSPLAVQVPDAGRGSLGLPIHALSQPTPEQAFASGDAPEAPEVAPAAPAEDSEES